MSTTTPVAKSESELRQDAPPGPLAITGGCLCGAIHYTVAFEGTFSWPPVVRLHDSSSSTNYVCLSNLQQSSTCQCKCLAHLRILFSALLYHPYVDQLQMAFYEVTRECR